MTDDSITYCRSGIVDCNTDSPKPYADFKVFYDYDNIRRRSLISFLESLGFTSRDFEVSHAFDQRIFRNIYRVYFQTTEDLMVIKLQFE